jgi:Mrp family chromosome partitioning ATPase
MEPIDYGGALRRSWRLLIALAILGAVIAVLVPVGHAKKDKSAVPYTATAIVGTPPNGQNSPLNGGVTSAQIAFVGNQTSTLQDVADAAGLDVPAAELPSYLSASIAASGSPGSAQAAGGTIKRNTPTVVHLTASGSTADQAVNLANVYAVVLQSDVTTAATDRQASNPKSAASQGGTAYTGYEVIAQATGAAHGTKVKASLGASRKVRLVAGLVIGALVGAAIVLLRELLDKRLRNAARAEANFGFPVVVEIPSGSLGAASALPGLAPMVDVIRDPDSPGAEAYRMLRVSVMFENLASLSGPTDPYAVGFDAAKLGQPRADQPIDAGAVHEVGDRRVVLVASAGTEPSRPYVAANLAAIYAEAGDRVVVISTGEVEAATNGSHSTTVSGEIRPEDIEAHLELSRLEHVSRLPLSPFIQRSGQLVTRMPAVLDAARQVSDVIIVEVPPLLGVHHAEALARYVDVVLVVAECRFTTFDHARRGGDLLRRMGAPVLGIVLTGVRGAHLDARPAALNRAPAAAEEPQRHDEPAVAIGAGAGSSSGPASDSQV